MTPIDHKRWYDAARKRVSTRRFGDAPDADEMDRLRLLTTALNGDGIRITIVGAGEKLFSGLLGSQIKGAQYAAAIAAEAGAEKTKAGYKGEAFVLEATAMGLATCWLGGTFKRAEAKRLTELKDDEKLVNIIAFGKPLIPFVEIPDSDRKRKDLPSLIKTADDDLTPWQNTALKCARIAPSAMNVQPWRFACAAGTICAASTGMLGRGSEVDLGIAMMHIDLGAAVSNVRGTWAKDKNIWIFTASGANA